MRIKLNILLLFSAQIIFAQFSAENIIETCVICQPEDSYSTDIDGDGDNDILIASSLDNKVSWFENLGNGLFGDPTSISDNIPRASAVLAADFDGDGHLDIAVSAVNERRIGILYNDGSGNFTEPNYMSSLSLRVESFVSADIDNDGDLDIVYSELGGASWYENLGGGEFTRRQIDQVGTIKVVHVEDINGDNKLDVLVGSNEDAKIAWYENIGDGEFAEPSTITEIGVNVFSISTGDIDNDGDVDILGKGFFSDRLAWYPNDGFGNFGNGIDVSSDQDRGISTSIEDIDGDGDLDIISASSYYMGQIICYPNDGNGGFSDQLSIGYEIPNIESIFVIDIDEDGALDIVSTARKYNQISWYRNEGDFNFSEHIISFNPNHRPRKIVSTDMNQDGLQDFFVLSESDNGIYWYLNSGDEQFDRQINISTSLDNLSLDVGLINEDAYPDILISTNAGVSWLENNGGDSFLDENIINDENVTIRRNSIIADLNGDGFNDILTCAQYLDKIDWMQNTGAGGFSNPINISSEIQRPEHLIAVDINSDGYKDIILSTAKGEILYIENRGDGTFSNFDRIDSLNLTGVPINITDVDGDGDEDVLAVSSQYVFWYENTDSGEFLEKQTIYEHTSTLYAQSIFGTDLDGDGDREVLIGAYSSILTSVTDNSNGIIYWENLGNNEFSEKKNIGRADHYNFIYPSDINSDGDYDVFVSSRDNAQISWYENLSDYPTISGRVFYDENESGFLDASEQPLRNTPVVLTPDALSSYTNANGEYRFYVDDGTYSLTTIADSCWVLTSDSLSYSMNIENSSFSNLNFGYNLSFENPHVQPRLYSGPTRCGFEVGFDLKVENDGCTIAKGLFGLVLDDLVTYVDASVAPTIVNGDTLWWSYSDLLPTEFASVSIIFEIAGIEFIEEVIEMDVLSLIDNGNTDYTPSGAYLYQSEINCAYDPNDKNVYPERRYQYGENYTFPEEELEYIIRFQNTGTDTAFTVVLKDTIDQSLDLSTFRPLTGSHLFETFLFQDGFVEFHFKDILLPDSTANEMESHGYVSYKIKPKGGLEGGTEIFNSAAIFFDFNPPILTNVVRSVIASDLPTTADVIDGKEESTFLAYPNPSLGIVNLSSDLTGDFKIELLTFSGRSIRSFHFFGLGEFVLNLNDIPTGMYMLSIQHDNVFEYHKILFVK